MNIQSDVTSIANSTTIKNGSVVKSVQKGYLETDVQYKNAQGEIRTFYIPLNGTITDKAFLLSNFDLDCQYRDKFYYKNARIENNKVAIDMFIGMSTVYGTLKGDWQVVEYY